MQLPGAHPRAWSDPGQQRPLSEWQHPVRLQGPQHSSSFNPGTSHSKYTQQQLLRSSAPPVQPQGTSMSQGSSSGRPQGPQSSSSVDQGQPSTRTAPGQAGLEQPSSGNDPSLDQTSRPICAA